MRLAGTFLLLSLALFAQPAIGETYPDRPIRLISPNPAGGANDTIVRIIAAKMSTILDAPVMVDNRGGAGGKIGAEAVARATPDGYTLLAGSVSTHSFAPVVSGQAELRSDQGLRADLADRAGAEPAGGEPEAAGAHASTNWSRSPRRSPGKLNYASGGPGSTSHFAVAMFIALAGIQDNTVHVPFRGGGPAMTATIAGDTQFFFSPIAGMVPFVEAGPVRALAVSGDKRSPALPNIPTISRSRHAALQGGRLVRPDGAGRQRPASIVGKLSDAVAQAVRAARSHRGAARPRHRADQPAGRRSLRPSSASSSSCTASSSRTSISRSANSEFRNQTIRE